MAIQFGAADTPELLANHPIANQALGAEMIADEWEITRAEMDELAVRSHRLAPWVGYLRDVRT